MQYIISDILISGYKFFQFFKELGKSHINLPTYLCHEFFSSVFNCPIRLRSQYLQKSFIKIEIYILNIYSIQAICLEHLFLQPARTTRQGSGFSRGWPGFDSRLCNVLFPRNSKKYSSPLGLRISILTPKGERILILAQQSVNKEN